MPGTTTALSFLNALTADERNHLVFFAQQRLAFFGLPTDLSDDLYQQSTVGVISGTRHPRAQDLASQDAFLNYMRGVINSVAEGWSRKECSVTKEYRSNHCSLDVIQDMVAKPEADPQGFKDLRETLFRRLRAEAPARLLPTIDAWEQCPDDRIPCITNRKHVYLVRQLAQKIARELEFTPESYSSS